MNNEQKQNLTVTIGIPTYWGGPSLLRSVRSLLASTDVKPFRLVVSVDAKPLQPEVERELKDLGVEIIFNAVRAGEIGRTRGIIELCQTDILVITHDDVIFRPDALALILNSFSEHPETTMIAANIQPTTPKRFFERIVQVGVSIAHYVGERWHNGDNYLMSVGRCLAYRTAHAQKFNIADKIVNCDAFFYFENKFCGGSFLALRSAVVFNQSPQKMSEHLHQSRRFFSSRLEMEHVFHKNLANEYRMPRNLLIKAVLIEFISHPLLTILYLTTEIYSKLGQRKMKQHLSNTWEPDMSTKR